MTQAFAVLPAVDVLDGRAVRLVQGDYDRVGSEAGDPLELVRRFAATRPPLVHVVALGAARDGGPPLELARAAVAAADPVGVQLGGGVRSVADAVALVEAGVARVIVGTAAFGPIPLAEFSAALGEKLAVSVDVAGGVVRTAGWLESSGLTAADAFARCSAAGVATVVCTAIERDGTAEGPALALLREARAAFAGRLLAAGGIRDAADVEAVRETGADGVVVGRALLDGTFSLSWLGGARARAGLVRLAVGGKPRVDGRRAAPALVDRPDDQRLAAARVAGGEDAATRGLVAGASRTLPRASRSRPSARAAPRLGPEEAHREQHEVGLEPSLGAGDRRERRRARVLATQWIALRRGRRRRRGGRRDAKSRSPPSLSAYERRQLLRPAAATA